MVPPLTGDSRSPIPTNEHAVSCYRNIRNIISSSRTQRKNWPDCSEPESSLAEVEIRRPG